jgi:uncharacterized protein (TIGR02001 family)
MKFAQILGVAAVAGSIALAPAAGSAQTTIDSLGLTVTVTPAVVSDYLFRGISQTRGGPAVQGTLDVEHSSGLYVGGFVSNATFVGTNLRQETDFNFGYRTAFGDLKLDIGGTYFGYPGYEKPPGSFDWAWWEVAVRASYQIDPVKLVGSISYSPNFNFESGNATYIEGGFDLALDFGFTAAVRAGYQWVEDNRRWGAPDYGVFSVGVSREIAFGVIGGLTLSHTTLTERDCFGGLSVCGTRFVASVSRPF